jgi:TolB protein
MTAFRHHMRIWCLTGACLSTLPLAWGCQSTGTTSGHQLIGGPVGDEEAVLATTAADPTPAAPQRPVSLFGEFPDGENVPFEARPVHSLLQHTDCPEGADFDPVVDPTGKTLAFASTRHARRPDIYVKGVGSAAITQVTSDPASDIQPEFSPDGKHLVFASDRSGSFDIWMVGTDGSQPTQLTHEPAHEVHPTWAPDSQRIAYCSMNPASRQWELWMLDLRQPGLRKLIGYGLYPRWSPTEDVLVYQRARERGQRLFSVWTLRLVNGEPRFPTEVSASASEAHILPTFSPDGRYIAFCAVTGQGGSATIPASAASDIWVVNTDGSEPVRLTEGHGTAYSPFWAKDGRTYFTSTRGGKETIWSVRPVIDASATRPAPAEPTLEHAAFSLDSAGSAPAEGR